MKRNEDLHPRTEGVVIFVLIVSAMSVIAGMVMLVWETGIVFGTISIALTVAIIWGGRMVKWIREAWLAR